MDYLYSDEVDLSSLDLCCHLLKLAHRFEVVGLVGACVSTLEKGLDVPSAVERLMLADELELPGLKAVCCAYLAWPDRLPEAQASSQWERLVEQRPRLMAELLKAVAPPRKRGAEDRDWSVLSLAELRVECSSRRLPTSGSKAILIDRLSKS
uniref:SAP domain-containing protein n=1 Tax=Alexandrium andersonii TaxID=327968 RepID=A0A7S2F0J0_9DINO